MSGLRSWALWTEDSKIRDGYSTRRRSNDDFNGKFALLLFAQVVDAVCPEH